MPPPRSRILTPILPPPAPPLRRTARALPPYRHVPGLTAHPVRHPEGHSYGLPEPAIPPAAARLPEGWESCEEYLYGVDLFNRAFFWEAHEAWELLWHGAGHATAAGRFLQGLIQVAAALLQQHLGSARGPGQLLARAALNLGAAREESAAREGGTYMGLAIAPWQRQVELYLREAGVPFPFILLPPLQP